jgi:protein dithiol oxidoreductase (disulfide-forming)
MTGRRAFIASGAAVATLCLTRPGKAIAASALDSWRAGVNYRLLENPQPPTAAAGKVEVCEVFWYGCAHCYALEPVLEEWNRSKSPYIEFVRVPVVWGPQHRQHAKLYYTLLALKRPDLHSKVFDAIHKEGMPLSGHDEVTARAAQLAFLKRQDVTDQQFDAAYDSMTVAMQVQRAEQYTRTFRVDNVPQLFVNGKYATSVGEAGGDARLILLLESIAESEKR